MTTIAYDGKVLATDSRGTTGSTITSDKRKKIQRNIGMFSALVYCGLTAYGALMVSTVLCNIKTIEELRETCITDACVFILVEEDTQKVFTFSADSDDGSTIVYENIIPWAWGSGREYAIAAMDFGRTAVEAVKYASTRDVYTNKRIQKYVLKEV